MNIPWVLRKGKHATLRQTAGTVVDVNLHDAVTDTFDQAVIAEVELGEVYIKAKLETAMEERSLSTEARSLISQRYESARSGHGQMRDLKHGLST